MPAKRTTWRSQPDKSIPRSRRTPRTSTTDVLKKKAITGGVIILNKAGLEFQRKYHPIFKVVNEIISLHLAGQGLWTPKMRTKRRLDKETARGLVEFEAGITRRYEKGKPYFRVDKKSMFKGFVIEQVYSEFGLNNIGLFRITSKSGESVLVKVQKEFPSKLKDLEKVRNSGHKTPNYFLELDFGNFSVQVMEEMKLSNVVQFREAFRERINQAKQTNAEKYKRMRAEYDLIQKEFTREARRLKRKLYPDEVIAKNCLIRIERKKGKMKPYFYWIDLF
jgi:hypothetical protein